MEQSVERNDEWSWIGREMLIMEEWMPWTCGFILLFPTTQIPLLFMNGLPDQHFAKLIYDPLFMGTCPLFLAPVKTQPSALQNFQPHVSLWAEHRSLNPGLRYGWQLTEPDLFLPLLLLVCVLTLCCSHWYLVRGLSLGEPQSTNQQAAHDNNKCFWFLKRIRTDCVSFSPMI